MPCQQLQQIAGRDAQGRCLLHAERCATECRAQERNGHVVQLQELSHRVLWPGSHREWGLHESEWSCEPCTPPTSFLALPSSPSSSSSSSSPSSSLPTMSPPTPASGDFRRRLSAPVHRSKCCLMPLSNPCQIGGSWSGAAAGSWSRWGHICPCLIFTRTCCSAGALPVGLHGAHAPIYYAGRPAAAPGGSPQHF
jgi:hypothetical protein